VIIKKQANAVIDIPLGAIFRGVNIIEYKSPGDYLSIADYHKVQSYAHLYCALNGLRAGDMTISFVTGKQPRKVLRYIREELGHEVKEKWPGIYYAEGGDFGGAQGVQIVETKKLREEDGGIWLRDLREGLKGEELRGIIERGQEMPEGTPLGAYLYMVFQANGIGLEEVVEMPNVTFEEVLEKHGFIAKWREEGLEEAVKRMQKHDMDPTEIARVLELPLATVIRYLDAE
jgi:hypothetical protein